MLFFVILLLFCLPSVLLSVLYSKTSKRSKEHYSAELLYPMHDEEYEKNKWYARLITNEEDYFIVVICNTEHLPHDVVEVCSCKDNEDYPLFLETP